MKLCNKCGRLLDENLFHRNFASKDGLTSQCKECRNSASRLYYANPIIKEQKKQYKQRYTKEHKQQMSKYAKEYIHRPEVKQRLKNYATNLYTANFKFKADVLTINACSRVLSGKTKQSPSLEERCGYTAEQLRKHIELQFTSEMNWDNYGIYWELDYIIPRFKFYYESYDDAQFKNCWALSNLRPLEVNINRCRPKV